MERSGDVGIGGQHPLLTLLDTLDASLAERGDGPAWTMTPAEIVEGIARLEKHVNAIDSIRLAMLREGDRHQVGAPIGFANTGAWYAGVAGITKPAAHRRVRLAERLDDEQHAPLREAMGRGEVNAEQASVIVRSVEEIPADLVDPGVPETAEKQLVAFADHHDPKELRLLGRRILHYVAPDAADEADRRALEAEEREAKATAFLEMRPDGHGSVVGRF